MILLLLACGGPPPAPKAAEIPFDPTVSGGNAQTVQDAINDLYRHQREQEVPPAAPIHDESNNLSAQIQALELRVARLEASQMGTAAAISYDPRSTTLNGKDLQSALTELELKVEKMEKQDPGTPGSGLFELRDKNGRPVQPGQPGGQPPNGQPPPNGQQGPGGGQRPPNQKK